MKELKLPRGFIEIIKEDTDYRMPINFHEDFDEIAVAIREGRLKSFEAWYINDEGERVNIAAYL